jgi:hypothetical protein
MGISKKTLTGAAAVMATSLAGCSSYTDGLNTWQPSTDAMRPSTSYTSALACIRGLINERGQAPGGKPITVTVGFMPDTTGRLLPGLRDMVTSATSDVVTGGKMFELVEIGSFGRQVGPTYGSKPDVTGSLLGVAGITQRSGYQIVGAVTQADSKNSDRGGSAGFSHDNHVSSGVSIGNTVSTVGVDLRLVDMGRGLSVPYTTRSMLRVQSSGVSADISFKIGNWGGDFSFESSTSEGPHQAVRQLVELSVAELLGQAANVPYWSCFGANRDDPEVRAKIQTWWSRMNAEQTEADVRQRLRALGYEVPSEGSAEAAIKNYQRSAGLVVTGKPSYETFASLVVRQMDFSPSTSEMPRPESKSVRP